MWWRLCWFTWDWIIGKLLRPEKTVGWMFPSLVFPDRSESGRWLLIRVVESQWSCLAVWTIAAGGRNNGIHTSVQNLTLTTQWVVWVNWQDGFDDDRWFWLRFPSCKQLVEASERELIWSECWIIQVDFKKAFPGIPGSNHVCTVGIESYGNRMLAVEVNGLCVDDFCLGNIDACQHPSWRKSEVVFAGNCIESGAVRNFICR